MRWMPWHSLALATVALMTGAIALELLSQDSSRSTDDPMPVSAATPWYRSPTFYNLTLLQIASVLVARPQAPMLGATALANGINSETIGFLLSLMPLSSCLLAPLIGWLLPRAGLRPMLVSGALLLAASGTAFALLDLVRGPAFLAVAIVLRLLFGVAETATATTTLAYWNTAFDSFTTVHAMASSAAMAVGMLAPVASALIRDQFGGYAMSFAILGGSAMTIVAACTVTLPSELPLPPAPAQSGGRLRGLVRQAPPVVPALAVLLANTAAASLVQVLAPYVLGAMDVSDTGTSVVFALTNAAGAVGMFLGSHQLEACGHRPASLLLGHTGAAVLALALLALCWTPAPVVAAFTLLSLSTSMAGVASAYVVIDAARQYDPALVAILSGLKHGGQSGGKALGDLCGGFLYDCTSLATTVAAFAACSLAAAAAFARARGRDGRRALPGAVPITDLDEPLLPNNRGRAAP